MDETTKIVLGTLSGFTVAFLSEPIRLYFGQLFKKKQLRKALYHEIFWNYEVLWGFMQENSEIEFLDSLKTFELTIRHLIRMECYRHYVNEEASIFYQLREAVTIISLYSLISFSIDYAENHKAGEKDFRKFIRTYLEGVDDSLQEKAMNKYLYAEMKRSNSRWQKRRRNQA